MTLHCAITALCRAIFYLFIYHQLVSIHLFLELFAAVKENVERTVNSAVDVPSPTASPVTTPAVSPTPTREGIRGMGNAPPALTPIRGQKSRPLSVPPALEEVAAYGESPGSMVDPQGFVGFYAARTGW